MGTRNTGNGVDATGPPLPCVEVDGEVAAEAVGLLMISHRVQREGLPEGCFAISGNAVCTRQSVTPSLSSSVKPQPAPANAGWRATLRCGRTTRFRRNAR